jgi:protein arginine kinase
MTKWYNDIGNEADTVISTRIRLARNLKGIPFPSRMSDSQRHQVNTAVKDALFSNPVIKDNYSYIEMNSLSDTQAMSMVERHLISPEFAQSPAGRALILSNDESVSIMLCEEDHIRIQVMRAGLALDEAYEEADRIDSLLDEKLEYAFDERLGYLTECPTNLGTGLRASVMLHLPALEAGGAIGRLSATVSKIGLTIRGTYGEGSRATAAMYQLSNQVTLGISEKEAISNLRSIAVGAMAQERSARSSFDPDGLEDAAFRALGTLKYARSISSEEFMELISKVRLGISLGIIKDIPLQTVESLIIEAGPATIQAQSGSIADPAARDKKRAEIIRERL